MAGNDLLVNGANLDSLRNSLLYYWRELSTPLAGETAHKLVGTVLIYCTFLEGVNMVL